MELDVHEEESHQGALPMKDKIFICQRCQERVKEKDSEAHIEFEWSKDSHKAFKKEAKGAKNYKKPVLTTCLGPCPKNRITYIETEDGKLKKDKSYPIKFSAEQILKKLYK